MTDRVLVTGGAGFIGSHLVDRLVATGHAVTVLDDFSTGRRVHLDEAVAAGDVRILQGSVLDSDAVADAIYGCGVVYHLAVQCVRRSLGNPLENHEINATGTLRVLEEARKQGINRFVYCSSSEVYGNASDGILNEDSSPCEPVTVYGAAKLAGELYTHAYRRTYGLPTLVVRPFNAFGPREHHEGDLAEVIPRFAIRVLNGLPPLIFGDGSNGRDFTYVTDVARGLAMAGRCDALIGRTVNIARGRMVTIREVADAVLTRCQRPDLQPILHAPRPGDVRVLKADTRRAQHVLGFAAEIPFEEGIEKYLDWFTANVPDPATLLEERPENWVMPGETGGPAAS